MTETLSVGELLKGVDHAIAATYPAPVWVRGEISGFRRTNRGAVYFRLVDTESAESSVEVGIRTMIVNEVERSLDAAKVGSLRDGIEIRVQGTVGLRFGRIQVSVLSVDPEFIAGRLALDRDELLRRLKADGSTEANRRLPIPLVPLRIGLVTSVGSAAHADFLDQLRRSGFRFKVLTVESRMQGEDSIESVTRALIRLGKEAIDVVAIVRGGGAKLDLVSFDSEKVARAIAGLPHPVLAGIGHEIDRTISDEVAAVSQKTPTAVAEWLVTRVAEYSNRLEIARQSIRDAATGVLDRSRGQLDGKARELAGVRGLLRRHQDLLEHLGGGVAERARHVVGSQEKLLDSLDQVVATVGLEPTLKRGFAVVTRPDGTMVKRASGLSRGDQIKVRMADGSIGARVEEKS